MKKHMNAYAIYQASLSQQPQHYLPPPHAVPSSGSQEFYRPQPVVPSDRDSKGPSISCSPSSASVGERPLIFSNQQEFPPRVPTIMETSQDGSRDGIELNMRAAGYSLADPVNIMSSAPGLGHYASFDDSFVFQQFPGEFDCSPFIEASAMSVQEVQSPESLSASESPNNMPSLTSAYSHPDWSNDRKLSLPADSPLDPLDSANEPTPTWPSAQTMAQQQGFYAHQNPSAPSMSPQDQSEFASPAQLDLPVEAYGRRESSASALVDSMSTVDIANQETAESSDSSQTQHSSIAARRQKARPANLGPAALRSASYSAGMPGSPGANQSTAPDQALRRIRSTGVANVGRISKPIASGQRSPLNFSFADAAASPKFARHVSNYSVSTISSGPLSATTNSLAPPTPLTPGDFGHFPHWQSQGPMKLYPSDGNMNGLSIHEESYHNGLYLNVSSPPGTPLDADQYAHFRTHMHARQQAMYHDTPPQSAPATQLAFPPTSMMPQAQSIRDSMGADKPHIRRPSLPNNNNNNNNFNVEHQQNWPAVPLFNTTGDLQLSNPLQFNAHNIPQFIPQPTNPNMQNYSMAMPDSLVKSEFAVHHYSPPQGASCTPSPPRNDSVPKLYHFSNAGPKDFQGSTATKS
jgi:hypothetical protein